MAIDWNERYDQGKTPWSTPGPCAELVRLVSEGQVSPCRTVDVGCGTGSDAIWLASRGFDVTAYDVSSIALRDAALRATEFGANVRFVQADLLGGSLDCRPAPFVLDNGFYHCARTVDLAAYQAAIAGLVAPGGKLVVFAGNRNDPLPAAGGPFRVAASELCSELEPAFELVQLREFRFHAVRLPEGEVRPLGWSALFRRKGS